MYKRQKLQQFKIIIWVRLIKATYVADTISIATSWDIICTKTQFQAIINSITGSMRNCNMFINNVSQDYQIGLKIVW